MTLLMIGEIDVKKTLSSDFEYVLKANKINC